MSEYTNFDTLSSELDGLVIVRHVDVDYLSLDS